MKFGKPQEEVRRTLYTGLGVVNVIAINPTISWLKENKLTTKDEVSYVSDKDGIKSVRFDIYVKTLVPTVIEGVVKNEELISKLTYWMDKKARESQAGQVQKVNKYAQFYYGDVTTQSWFFDEETRPAYIGEEDFIQFIKVWSSLSNYLSDEDKAAGKKPDEIKFANIDAFFDGNFSELHEAVQQATEQHKVKVLFGVNGKYQGIYTKFIGGVNTSADSFATKLKGQYTAFKNHDYVLVDKLMPFTEDMRSIPVASGASNVPSAKTNDDAPF